MYTNNKNSAKQKSTGFSEDERAAMKERAKELAAESRSNRKREDGEKDVLEAISVMPEPDRSMAKRIHEIIKIETPDLMPKTWYGMPAYTKDDKVVCFFQAAYKFKYRYSTLGFMDKAKLDDGPMWPVTFAIKKLTASEEAKIAELVKKAVS